MNGGFGHVKHSQVLHGRDVDREMCCRPAFERASMFASSIEGLSALRDVDLVPVGSEAGRATAATELPRGAWVAPGPPGGAAAPG